MRKCFSCELTQQPESGSSLTLLLRLYANPFIIELSFSADSFFRNGGNCSSQQSHKICIKPYPFELQERIPSQAPVQYAASRDRQWHIYTTTEKPNIRRMFLRSLVRQSFLTAPYPVPTLLEPAPNHLGYVNQIEGNLSGTFSDSELSSHGEVGTEPRGRFPDTDFRSPRGGGFPNHLGTPDPIVAACEALVRSMKGALEELEVAAHEQKADHVHLYMSVLQELELPRVSSNSEAETSGRESAIAEREPSESKRTPTEGMKSFSGESQEGSLGGYSWETENGTLVDAPSALAESRTDSRFEASFRTPPAVRLDVGGIASRQKRHVAASDVQNAAAGTLPAAESDDESTVYLLQRIVKRVNARLGKRLYKQGIAIWEFRIAVRGGQSVTATWRVVVESPCIQGDVIHVYREALLDGRRVYLTPKGLPSGNMNGIPIDSQYGPLGSLEKRRLAARRAGTTFCFDFPLVFSTALASIWESELRPPRRLSSEAGSANPSNPGTPSPWRRAQYNSFTRPRLQLLPSNSTGAELPFSPTFRTGSPLGRTSEPGPNAPPAFPLEPLVESRELAWSAEGVWVETDRPACENDIGMVAWRMKLRTPECAEGREIVVVANDCTVGAG